jgi:carboxyl-terminal processing protease
MQSRKLAALGAVLIAALSGCTPQALYDRVTSGQPVPLPTVPADTPMEVQAVVRDYDFAVNSLRALYFKSDAVGRQWQQKADEERKALLKADDPQQFVKSLRSAITALGDDDIGIQAGSNSTQTFGGIGVQIDLPANGKDRLLILNVYPNSPAERAGIKPHDAIVAIDGKPISAEEGPAVILRVRGEPGSKFTATVRTPNGGERDVSMTRRVIEQTPKNTPIVYRFIDDTGIAYISPNPSAGEFMREDVAAALRALNKQRSIDGIVLDLRIIRSPDFPLDSMLNLFVSGDRIGDIQSRVTKEQIKISGKGVAGSQNVRLALLVSDLSTGPAEVFAGLLQDLGRAKVIGNKTVGRTASLTRVILPVSGLEMQIPSGEYLGRKGSSWYGKGVAPDVLFEQTWEQYTDEDDPQLTRAAEELSK